MASLSAAQMVTYNGDVAVNISHGNGLPTAAHGIRSRMILPTGSG